MKFRARFVIVFVLLHVLTASFESTYGANVLDSAVSVYISKAQHALKQGNVASARAFLEQAKKTNPDDPKFKEFEREFTIAVRTKIAELRREAEFHMRNKNVPKALEVYRKILNCDPDDKESVTKINELKQDQLSVDQFQRTGIVVSESTGRSYDPSMYSAVSLLVRARDALSRGEVETSRRHVEEILAREPNYREALQLRGEIDQQVELRELVTSVDDQLSRGMLAKALDSADELIRKYPSQSMFYVLRARIHLKSFRFRDALSDLREARLLGHDFAQIRPWLVDVYAGMGEYAQAYALAQGNSEFSPCRPWETLWFWYFKTHTVGWFLFFGSLGILFFALYKFWRQFDTLVGRYSTAHFVSIAVCLYHCATSGAICQIDRLIAITKRMPHPWWLYVTGLSLMEIGQTDRAQEMLLRSASEPEFSMRAHLFLGLIRGEAEPRLADYDLEQVIITAQNEVEHLWLPEFVRDLETNVLSRYRERLKNHRFLELAIESFQGVQYS